MHILSRLAITKSVATKSWLQWSDHYFSFLFVLFQCVCVWFYWRELRSSGGVQLLPIPADLVITSLDRIRVCIYVCVYIFVCACVSRIWVRAHRGKVKTISPGEGSLDGHSSKTQKERGHITAKACLVVITSLIGMQECYRKKKKKWHFGQLHLLHVHNRGIYKRASASTWYTTTIQANKNSHFTHEYALLRTLQRVPVKCPPAESGQLSRAHLMQSLVERLLLFPAMFY